MIEFVRDPSQRDQCYSPMYTCLGVLIRSTATVTAAAMLVVREKKLC